MRSPIRSPVLEEHFRAIVETLGPHWDTVRAAAMTGTAELSVALYVFRGAQPIVSLSPDSVTALASLRAMIDIDVLAFRPTS